MHISKEIIDAIESLDWDYKYASDDKTISLKNYSPEGQDISFEIFAENDEELISKLQRNYESYDPEEEASLWYGQNRGEPSSLETLLKDMKATQEMYRRLYLVCDRTLKNLKISLKDGKKKKFKFEFIRTDIIRRKACIEIQASSEQEARTIATTYNRDDICWPDLEPDDVEEESLDWRYCL